MTKKKEKKTKEKMDNFDFMAFERLQLVKTDEGAGVTGRLVNSGQLPWPGRWRQFLWTVQICSILAKKKKINMLKVVFIESSYNMWKWAQTNLEWTHFESKEAN